MFSTLSPLKAMVLVGKFYAAFVTLIVFIMFVCGVEASLQAAFRVVFGGALLLEGLLFLTANCFWKKIWARYPVLNEWLFPDLNGQWKMEIKWTRNGEEGAVEAEASIKQSLFGVSMEVHSEGSDSETLVVKTIKDINSSRPMLYYFYRVIPKNTGADSVGPYEGASILKLYGHEGGVLRGNYFTSQNSNGYFELTRLS